MGRDKITDDNAIVKNPASQQSILESTKINDPLDGHKVYNMISQGLIEEVVSMLDHRNYKYGDDPSIDRVFDQKINLVQKWMERMLDISLADGSYAWRMIKDMELPWDSVDSWWTDHKAETVRRLLKLLKKDRYEDVLGIIEDILDDLGLAWPELDVIRRSAQAELDRISTRDDLDENEYDDEDDDGGPIVSMSSPDEQIVDRMYRWMRAGSWMALQDGISKLEERRMPDHMIEGLLSQQADSIARWLDSWIKEGSHNNRMIEQAWKLLEMGARWPSLVQLFNKHKDLIVRDMLTQMKTADSMDLEDLEGHLRQLYELGMTWPEMDVISRSVNAELDRIYNIDESGDMLGYRISKGDLIDGMQDSLRAGVNGAWANNYAHMRPWSKEHTVKKLTGIKPDIVAWVNKYLSSEKDSDWRYGKQAVLDLDDLGVDWPELWLTVDRHRAAWLRRWLTQLKDFLGGGYGEELEDLSPNIRYWRDLFAKHGLTWPEIDTILASIHNAYKEQDRIQEAESLMPFARREIDDLVKDTARQIGQPNTSLALRSMIKQMFDKYKLDPEEFAEFIAPIKDDIVAFTDANLAGRAVNIGLGDVGMMSRLGVLPQEIKDVVNKNKSPIIKVILEKIKSHSPAHAMEWVEMLNSAGMDWPELGIMRKSADTYERQQQNKLQDEYREQQRRQRGDLDESALARAAVNEAKQMLWSQLPDGNWWTVGRALDNMIYAKVPHSEIFAVLDEYKEDILAQQNRLTQGENSEVLAGVSNLRRLRDIGAGWPEIDQMLTRNKRYIMRAALTEIKGYSTEDYGDELPHIYKNLKKLKVSWPEMAVIADGIDSIQQLGEDWHDVDSDDHDEVYGRMGSALQDIENGLRPSMSGWHAEVLVDGLADLAQLLDNHDWLSTPTPSEWQLDLVKQKPLFVKALLIGMKHSDTDNVLDAIRMLEDYWHVRWPELDIMHKSMRAGKVNESVPSHDEEAYRYAEDTAATLPEEADDPDSCMYVFLTSADYPEVIGPWAAEYFLPHKDTWIRWLLAQMKGDEYDTDEIWEAVNMLQRMQLPWPELDIIKRSIEGDFRG